MPDQPQPPQWLENTLAHLPAGDDSSHLGAIYNHLQHHYEPACGPEILKVQEISRTWYEIWQLNQKTATLQALQRNRAAEDFDIKTHAHYEKLNRDLRKSYTGHYKALSENALGVDLLINRLYPLKQHLDEGLPIDLEHLLDALLASGSSDDVRRVDELGMRIMACFLSSYIDPGLTIARWIVRSGLKNSESHELYARVTSLARTPISPENAIGFLKEFVQQNIDRLTLQRRELTPELLQQRTLYSQAHQADRSIIASLRTLESFRRAQYTRLNKLEKELAGLRRERLKDQRTLQEHLARLEAIRNGTAQPRKQGQAPNPQNSAKVQDLQNSTAATAPSFPEMELVAAVQQSAAQFQNDQSTDRPAQPETPAAEMKQTAPVGTHFSNNFAARWSNLELAKPSLRPGFKQTYQKAGPRQRKALMAAIAHEKDRRAQLPLFQPSG